MSSQGFTLFEILISLTLIAIVLLGFDVAQLVALRDLKSAYYFARATQQLENFHAQINVFPENQLSEVLAKWNIQNQIVLPQGKGYWQNHALTISWGDHNSSECLKSQVGRSGCIKLTFT